ncbi:DUF4190 domain-containing protein [Kitasatospora aureofaciens]|uniref:DUF4190 domain-containing protein n=1 Tax=Kitasatospora aureofaciens TaxID=1894 RepID=UPI00061DB5D2|nr:DUF4190 domain-containing protein [Kitasatospora aureofaciens]
MTAPVPPDSPKSTEEAPAGTDPWAPPNPGAGEAPGQGEATVPAPAAAPGEEAAVFAAPPGGHPGGHPGAPYWPPYPVPPYPVGAPQPRNGLGIAAMVLGIVGTALSLAVILFWLSWLPALLALVFGFIGLGYARRGVATNRGMALAGVVLGITGLVVSIGAGVFVVARVHTVNEERRAEADAARARADAEQRAADERLAKAKERLEAARKKAEADRRAAAADERARRLSFGQSYTYGDGLKVTMAAPEPYVPSRTVFEPPKDATIVQVKITVVNTGSKEVSLHGSGLPFVHDAKGGLVTTLIDGSDRMKILGGSLAPGQDATGVSAYALPNGAADTFSVEFDYGSGLERKNVIWTGAPS